MIKVSKPNMVLVKTEAKECVPRCERERKDKKIKKYGDLCTELRTLWGFDAQGYL